MNKSLCCWLQISQTSPCGRPSMRPNPFSLPQTSIWKVRIDTRGWGSSKWISGLCQEYVSAHTKPYFELTQWRGLFKDGRMRRRGLVCLCVCVCQRAYQRIGTYNVQRSHVPPPHSMQWVQAASGSTLDYLCVIERGKGREENKINTHTHYQSSLKQGEHGIFGTELLFMQNKWSHQIFIKEKKNSLL